MNRKNSELKDMARAFLLGNYRMSIAAFSVAGAITMAISMVFQYVAGEDSTVFFAVNILLTILEYVLIAGLLMMHLDIARRRKTGWQKVFEPFKSANRFIGLASVMLIVTALPFLPALIIDALRIVAVGQGGVPAVFSEDAASDAGGMVILLLIIGAIASIYITLSFFLSFFIMIDNPNLSVTGSLVRSFSLMKGNKVRLFLLELSFLGWFLLGIISFGIGLFWIVPYYLQTMTNFYLDLIREFDIRVSFSPEGLAEAGKFKDFLTDTVVVSVGDQAGTQRADTEKTEASEVPEAKAASAETEPETGSVSAETVEETVEKATVETIEETETADTSGEMSVLDDKFFDE